MRSVLLAWILAVAPAAAEEADQALSFDGAWSLVTSDPGCTRLDYPLFPLFVCDRGLTYWYFTNPADEAHPGYMRRAAVRRDGAFYVETTGRSDGTDAQQPAFRAWMAYVESLIANNRR